MATAYYNSFGVKAVKLWNLLPKRVNSITDSLDGFKTALGDFIGQIPDTPPVQGSSVKSDIMTKLVILSDCF